MAFVKVGFKDRKEIVEITDADGVKTEKIRLPEEVFLQQLYSKFIDKYSQYYFQYLKFKDKVTLEPLMPDQEALAEIRELQLEGQKIHEIIEENTAEIEEGISIMEKTKSEGMSDEAQRI